jgi:hypothetical protein
MTPGRSDPHAKRIVLMVLVALAALLTALMWSGVSLKDLLRLGSKKAF